MKHDLKLNRIYFNEVLEGRKTCEVRIDDRGFNRFDTLVLREFDKERGYSGREIEVFVSYVQRIDICGLASYAILSFQRKEIRHWSHAAKRMLQLALTVLLLSVSTTARAELSGAALDALLPKIVAAESSGFARAIGDNGKARGLMQIQRPTWERFSGYSWEEAFDPGKNLQVGRRILEDLNDRLGKDATAARIVFAYNTGKIRHGALPAWTKRHPNKIYRRILNG